MCRAHIIVLAVLNRRFLKILKLEIEADLNDTPFTSQLTKIFCVNILVSTLHTVRRIMEKSSVGRLYYPGFVLNLKTAEIVIS